MKKMVKHAVLIIAHNNVWTLKKIIEMLDSQYFDIFIHIDKKSNIEIQEISENKNVYVYKEIDVRWGDFTQVETELLLLKKACEKYAYGYYHLISGIDIPLKKPQEIYGFFEKNKGKEFLHFESNNLPLEKVSWLKYYYYFRRISKKSKLCKILEQVNIGIQKVIGVNRIKNNNVKFMTGANWFSITNEFVVYVLKKEKFIYSTFRKTRSPDEFFMQTLLYNSSFVNNLYYSKYDDNYEKSILRFIDWNRGNPYIFKSDDFNDLINSQCIFARKVDENIDRNIIEKIGNYIIKKDKE